MRGHLLPLLCGAALSGLALQARADERATSCVEGYETGQRLRLAGKLVEARAALQSCSRNECPAVVLRDCARWLREVEEAIPTVILSARDASGADLHDARILIDGRLVQSGLTGKPVEVAAGEHVFRFEVGAQQVESTVVVNVGEKNRVVRVTMEAAEGGGAHPGSSDVARVAPFVLGGVGLALATAGIVLDVVGSSELDDLHAHCNGLCSTSEVDATRTKIIVGDTLLAVGIATVGAAALWLVLRPPASASAVSSTGNARIHRGSRLVWVGGL